MQPTAKRQCVEYYQIPSDIIGLLLDYIPTHMMHCCRKVPSIIKHDKYQTIMLHKNSIEYVILIDAVIKNDIEYCQKILDCIATRIQRVTSQQQWAMRDIVEDNKKLRTIVDTSLRYGRIAILDHIQVNSHRYYDVSGLHPLTRSLEYYKKLSSLPHQSIDWICQRCVTYIDKRDRLAIFDIMIKHGDVEMMDKLYHYTHDKVPTNIILKILNDYKDPFHDAMNYPIFAIVKTPKVHAWAKTKEWPSPYKEAIMNA
jgi:hypothetical protein